MNKNKDIKIIFANCLIANGNRGCVALSITAMSLVAEVLKKKGIPYTFYLPQSGIKKLGKCHYHTSSVDLDFNVISNIHLLGIKNFIKNLIIKQYFLSKQIYKEADFIFDIGQGDSFADIYGVNRFNEIYSPYQLGGKYHIPYCILPQTIGPFASPVIKKKAKKGISRAKSVMVRDRQSYDYVKSEMPQCEVKEVIDVAFYMPYKKKEFNKNFIHVGLNISALLWNGGYTRNNQFGLKCDYQKTIREIIQYFLSIDNICLHLIPHVVGAERNVENDYEVSTDLKEEYNSERLILAPLFLDPIAAKSYIAGMDFFMGARMHSTIAAFSTGVPVVSMAYSRKFNGLFVDTLAYPHMVDLKTDERDNILKTIKDSFTNRVMLKAEIEKQLKTTVSERKSVLLNEITKFLNL